MTKLISQLSITLVMVTLLGGCSSVRGPGDGPEFAKIGMATANKYNTWAVVPEGTYFLLNTFTETASQTDEKRAAREKYKAERAAKEKEEGNE